MYDFIVTCQTFHFSARLMRLTGQCATHPAPQAPFGPLGLCPSVTGIMNNQSFLCLLHL